jgi:protein involved in polysaccharide export with SLBB domain
MLSTVFGAGEANRIMSYRKSRMVAVTPVLVLLGLLAANAQDSEDESGEAPRQPYLVQLGDVLQVSVWKEDYLQRDVLVRPDGGITFPLAGDVAAANHTVIEIRDALTQQLSRYIPDAVVTVEVKNIADNNCDCGDVVMRRACVMNPCIDIEQAD